MSSIVSCSFRHEFPWPYRNLDWSNDGRMCCPGCGADLERVWSVRSVYTSKYAYKQA